MERPQFANKKGFTLIELLIVIFIIGVIITIAILALGDMGKSRRAKYFAQSLKAKLMYAEEYAVIQPTSLIFNLSGNQFQFKALKMIAYDDGRINYAWTLPDALNGEKNSIPSFASLKVSSNRKSTIHIKSNGSITPFKLRVNISNEAHYYLLTGNAGGEITLTEYAGDA